METTLILILLVTIALTAVQKLAKVKNFDILRIILIIMNIVLWIIFLVQVKLCTDYSETNCNYLLGAILGYGICAIVNSFFEDLTVTEKEEKEDLA